MGVSKAKGFVLADDLAGRDGRVYVLTGDGELQEGQFWESLGSAANRGLGRITAIVDHNKIQSDTWVSQVSDLGDLEAQGPRLRLGGEPLRRQRHRSVRGDPELSRDGDSRAPAR